MGAVPAPLRRPGPVRDAAVAGVTALAGIGLGIGDPNEYGHLPGLPWWGRVGVQVVGGACLLARRRMPLRTAGAVAALAVLAATPAVGPAAYTALVHVRPYRAWAVTAVLAVVAARPWSLQISRGADGDLRVDLQLMIVVVIVAAALGVRCRRALARDARIAAARQRLAAQVRAGERARLAGEMHDVITHRVSLMVLQAGALQVSTADEAVRRQADELRRSGRQALRELRELLSVIHDDGPAEPPGRAEPVLLDVADLVAESCGVGVPVRVTVAGTPVPLSTVVARTAYRVVQESLTNVRKHAPGSAVTLSVRYGDGNLRLTVHNTAPDGGLGAPLRGTGTNGGLHGLRQRVALVHGDLHAGPLPDGGFEVRAVLPAGAAP